MITKEKLQLFASIRQTRKLARELGYNDHRELFDAIRAVAATELIGKPSTNIAHTVDEKTPVARGENQSTETGLDSTIGPCKVKYCVEHEKS